MIIIIAPNDETFWGKLEILSWVKDFEDKKLKHLSEINWNYSTGQTVEGYQLLDKYGYPNEFYLNPNGGRIQVMHKLRFDIEKSSWDYPINGPDGYLKGDIEIIMEWDYRKGTCELKHVNTPDPMFKGRRINISLTIDAPDSETTTNCGTNGSINGYITIAVEYTYGSSTDSINVPYTPVAISSSPDDCSLQNYICLKYDIKYRLPKPKKSIKLHPTKKKLIKPQPTKKKLINPK